MQAFTITGIALLAIAVLALVIARRGRGGRNAPSSGPGPVSARRSAAPGARARPAVTSGAGGAPARGGPDAGDDRKRELQARVPHLFSLMKLEPGPEALGVPMAEDASAASVAIRSWLQDMSARAGTSAEILEKVQRAGWDPKALADIVQSDPLLAGSVLRIINSGFYGLRQRAASVLQAVLLLGVVEVRNLIWRACMTESLGLDRHPARSVIGDVWAHSFTASRLAYALARAGGHPRPDEIATAALLHDVGKIVFLVADTDASRGLYDAQPFSDHTRLNHELGHLGVTHARVSAMLVEAWGLPGKCITTIMLHHAPTYVGPRELEGPVADIALVHAADLLAHMDRSGRIGADAPPRPRSGWLELLGLGLTSDARAASSSAMTQPMARPAAPRRAMPPSVENAETRAMPGPVERPRNEAA